MVHGRNAIGAVCCLAGLLATADVVGQSPRVSIPPSNPAATNLGTVAPTLPGSALLSQPAFDPYSTSTIPALPNAASIPPSLPTMPSTGAPAPIFGSQGVPATGVPPPAAPLSTWPAWTDPNAAAAPGFPSTGYPAPYTQQPSVIFPNGLGPSWEQTWPWNCAQEGRYLRLFQDLRLRHTWITGGEGPQEMGINETEVATTVNFPNFLWLGAPLQVSPMFAMDWWDGPVAAPGTFPTDSAPPGAFGTPSRVYGASLGFGWQPRLTPQLAADLDVNVGVFTDFQGVTTDSVRFQGTGLGVIALTPTTTLKLGVTYLDRVDIKLLPAAGVLWTPTPRSRIDLFFPRPRASFYLTTLGNTDLWIFFSGEYGGGSWTIGESAVDRRMDVNDIRVGGGLEWTHQFGLKAFVETAYVFERELVFAAGTPGVNETFSLNDAVMVRGGLVY
ncbi:MAG: hypothetical protein AB7O38_05940 [Pirellulaceae bacterium]